MSFVMKSFRGVYICQHCHYFLKMSDDSIKILTEQLIFARKSLLKIEKDYEKWIKANPTDFTSVPFLFFSEHSAGMREIL